MKNVLLTSVFLIAFIFNTAVVSAKGIVVYGTGPHFETKTNLPDSETIEGKHVNFGIAYEQFSLFWIPVWNYGTVEYALVSDDGDTAYSPLSEEDLQYLTDTYSLDTASAPGISFWNKIGGKLIWIAVILLIIWGYSGKKKEKTEEETPEVSA
jgi:hypothetical protein